MQREKWLDIMKFVGIWIVYFSHMGQPGRLYDIAWAINVPLFFIVSGMCENFSHSKSFKECLKKNIISLLIPFYFFAIISILFFEIYNGWNMQTFKNELLVFLYGGIRNKSISAISIWFISCLFSVRLMFFLIQKLKFKALIIIVAALLYCNYGHIGGINNPSMIFNFDSASGYLFYYVLGWAGYPLLKKCFSSKSIEGIIIKYILGLISAIYTLYIYIGRNVFTIPILGYILRLCSPIVTVLGACIIIYLIALIVYHIQDIILFSKLGTETLYYCGSETILKRGMQLFLATFGLTVEFNNGFQIIVYTFLLLLFAHKYIVQIEKSILDNFKRTVTRILDNLIP